MFVLAHNHRVGIPLWSDSRLVNAAPSFCLCGSCGKHWEGCERHDEFVEDTLRRWHVAAPILGCAEFQEMQGRENLWEKYYASALESGLTDYEACELAEYRRRERDGQG